VSRGSKLVVRRADVISIKAAALAVAAIAGAGFASEAAAGKRITAWSAPVNIGPPINSEFQESGAKLTRHGRSLYFASNRPCGADDEVLDFNIWVARRAHSKAPWNEPECLEINANARFTGETPWSDREPEISDDGHWLFFASDRPGSLGELIPVGGDIWVSWRHDVRDDHAWSAPFPVSGLNTEASERGPQYFARGRGAHGFGGHGLPELYFATGNGGILDLWVVDLLHGSVWGKPEPVKNVNTDLIDAGGVLSRDGREMYLFRGDPRPQVGIDLDLFVARRPHLDAPWSKPVRLGEPLNSSANDQEPTLSDDDRLLIFTSNREGSIASPFGPPSLDLWMSERVLPKHPPSRPNHAGPPHVVKAPPVKAAPGKRGRDERERGGWRIPVPWR